jgi:tetratricopeptide (TPR) repeat protein
VGNTYIDYSQPILTAAPPVATEAPPGVAAEPPPTAADQAMQLLETGRDAFLKGDYPTAKARVEQALAKLPNDAVLHEFRSLVLFAIGQYKESAATIYAVLAVGPGWDWTTMIGFYADTDAYTQQLRALEQYRDDHRNASDANFLLAYHYLTCGYSDQAAAELKEVVRLNPADQLSAQLLASISGPGPAEPPEPAEPEKPAAPAKPVDAASLVGSWKASRADGSTFALDLSDDSKYTWSFGQKDKQQKFSGTYTVADNLLILKQGDSPAMVGQVTPAGQERFNFKLAGGGPSDPGLTFSR